MIVLLGDADSQRRFRSGGSGGLTSRSTSTAGSGFTASSPRNAVSGSSGARLTGSSRSRSLPLAFATPSRVRMLTLPLP